MVDDEDHAQRVDPGERARLQALAYGGTATPDVAAAAARALHALDRPRALDEPLALDQPRRTGPATDPPSSTATRPPDASVPTGGAPALPGEARSGEAAPLPRPAIRRRRAVLLGALVVVPTLAAFGIGLLVGTGQRIGFAPTPTPPTVGVSLDAVMHAKQELLDRVPTAIIGGVRPSSTRLVFSNRSLSGDDAMTPWDVYIGEDHDPSKLCLIATANALTSTTICFPRARAEIADLQFVAQIASGTLTVTLDDGVLTGRAR